MSKEWEKDFDEVFQIMGDGFKYPHMAIPKLLKKHIKEFIAKQRTQLLDQVKEEVIGLEGYDARLKKLEELKEEV